MSYSKFTNRIGWKKNTVVKHKDITHYERFKQQCLTDYYHLLWNKKGQHLTDELNNPNFNEIVDNCKNGLSYDTKHERNSGTVRRIGTI